ncbi:DUF6538 domain-containing protein [Paraburkholderia sp. GAS32]|uniref:DUF6538 domain-containing protein n=1 Tax=Paraburkholderia sp. GAS32 TaxID=3035129 RepID=UPI003D1AA509
MTAFRLNSIMTVSIRYLWPRPGTETLWFKRKVPNDLVASVGKTWIQFSLGTRDPKVAARLISSHVTEQDRQWADLRNPTRAGLQRQAHQLLGRYGIDPGDPQATPEALDAFYDFLDDHLPRSVREDEDIIHGHQVDPHLSPVNAIALQMLQARAKVTLADCLDQYTAARPNTEKDARLVFGYLRQFLGSDRELGKVRRSDVNRFVAWLLAGHHAGGKSVSTTTVGRYLTTLRAAFGLGIRENELGIDNVFAKVEIPGAGKDAKERLPFTVAQLMALHVAVDAWAASKGWDQLRCIVTVLAETGCRLAEVVGLAAADVHLHAATPYIDLKEHSWRTLKNDTSSIRKVPLTPRAIMALKEAHKIAHSSAFAFPRYTTAERCSADSVSAVLNKWIRGQDGLQGSGLSCHSLRHSMKDQLRAAGCPDSGQDQILGHATPGVGASYGKGYPLEMLADWLTKATEAVR